MVLNIMLVEDELIVRKGLIALVDWEKYGMKVAFEATNGEQALQLLQEHEIDIILTDIRMPMMNGIELTRQVRSTYPEIKVMLLTCYDDFEYVQEALELGASCYLLKTDLEDGSLEKQLAKVGNEISCEREEKRAVKELEVKAQQTSSYMQESQLRNILKGNLAPDALNLKLGWLNKPHLLIRIVVEQSPYSIEVLKRKFEDLSPSSSVLVQLDSQTIFALVSQPTEWSELKEGSWQDRLIKQMEQALAQEAREYSLYYFVSEDSQSLNERGNWLIEKSNTLLFYYGFGQLTNLGNYEPKLIPSYHTLNIQKLNEFTILRDWTSVKKMCDAAFTFYEQYEVDEETVKVNVVTLVETIMSGLQSNSYLFTSNWGSNSLDFKEKMKDITLFTEMKSWFYQGLSQLEESRMIFIGGAHQVVKQVIAYIDYNYSNEITLEELSMEVGLSRSYLSTIFKKETSKSVVEYINEVRLIKAKQLLVKSDLKVYEIADKIGFKDPKYFSKQFKRYTGVSPNEYKSNLHEFI